jgi:hypothetical protein
MQLYCTTVIIQLHIAEGWLRTGNTCSLLWISVNKDCVRQLLGSASTVPVLCESYAVANHVSYLLYSYYRPLCADVIQFEGGTVTYCAHGTVGF